MMRKVDVIEFTGSDSSTLVWVATGSNPIDFGDCKNSEVTSQFKDLAMCKVCSPAIFVCHIFVSDGLSMLRMILL
jgi:hypothetical protein